MDLKSTRKHISKKCSKTIPITSRLTEDQFLRLKAISNHSGQDRSSLICVAVERFVAEYENTYGDIFEAFKTSNT